MYETVAARLVAVLLRSGKTPAGREVRGHIGRLVRRIRTHWPDTSRTICGDSHYGRHEAKAWCEAKDVDYLIGLGGNEVPDRQEPPPIPAAAQPVLKPSRTAHRQAASDAQRASFACGQ